VLTCPRPTPTPTHNPTTITEPWSDEYYSFDLEAAMRAAGFEDVYTVEADHRHRAVFGSVPRA